MSDPLRTLVTRSISAAVLTLLLGGCAPGTREGPPAPVVSATPRPESGVATQPPLEAKPTPKPAAPAKPETRTYAYREPGTEPDPEAVPESAATPASAERVAAPKPAAPASQTPEPRPAVKTASPPPAPTPKEPPPAPSAPPETQVASAPPSPAPAPPAPTEKPLTPTLPPAADGLARQAEQQRQQGDYSGAAATLERSLRIAPREAYLWNRLARVRLEQGLTAQAGQLAARSNDLAGTQANIKRDNWRIIAESRRRAGDMAGASEAEQRAGGG